ncbi:MAG: nucleotidyltransferase [Oligoflexia bacterium]|nr:nucleotidyltransferase [Oligoflexia bacterium]
MKNLNSLLKVLLENKIDFVLIGGYAAILHGASQVTQDLDICALLTDENINKLRQAFKDYHPIHRMNPSFKPSLNDYPKPGQKLENMYLATDIGVLDILENVKPIGDLNCVKAKAIRVKLFGYDCQVISLDDLIEIKKSMPRAKDKTTLAELKHLKSKLKT